MDVILQSQNAVPQKIWSGWKTCLQLILRHPTVVSFWGSCWQRFLRQTRDKKASLRTLRKRIHVPRPPGKNIAQLFAELHFGPTPGANDWAARFLSCNMSWLKAQTVDAIDSKHVSKRHGSCLLRTLESSPRPLLRWPLEPFRLQSKLPEAPRFSPPTCNTAFKRQKESTWALRDSTAFRFRLLWANEPSFQICMANLCCRISHNARRWLLTAIDFGHATSS